MKSFYASVECVQRNLNPLTTNLVVADKSRTDKTICLAVSPSLKSYKIAGRARLFEVVSKVKEVNNARLLKCGRFTGSSYDSLELNNNPSLKLDYVVAPPQMNLYMDVSAKIYSIYLRYVSPEDIHVYSIDEVFIDCTSYLKLYNCTAEELGMKMVKDVLKETGITATCGVGTNLYLCKVAMDIVAKHMPADSNGVRIATLDEDSYRRLLWDHTPITDFWRIGRGYANKLASFGMYTMGDVARMSVDNEDFLYDLFGINAELLIDHAWGIEPCTMKDIKSYKPRVNSLSSGQVLMSPYTSDKTKVVVREMAELLSLDLVEKGLVTDQIVLTIGYDITNLENNDIKSLYKGPVVTDFYGRVIPKHSHGTITLPIFTSSTRIITEKVMELFDEISNPVLLSRRINITAGNVIPEEKIPQKESFVQIDMFTDYESLENEKEILKEKLSKEKMLQKTMLDIKKKYGKNSILKASSLKDGSTIIERNNQVGGHKA